MGKETGSSGFGGTDSTDDGNSDESDEDLETRSLKGSKEGWGKKKNYYAGDTADLEIGQDVQDAYDEEEAAMSLQKERLASMQESDFMDYMDEDEADSVTKGSGRGGEKGAPGTL